MSNRINHYKVKRVVQYGRGSLDNFTVDFQTEIDGETTSFLSLESAVRRNPFCKECASVYPFFCFKSKSDFF